MPRYYCDYCDTYLTHDSPTVRKQHNTGYKHKANVRNYFMQFEQTLTQQQLEDKQREYAERARSGLGPIPGGPGGMMAGGGGAPGMMGGPGGMPRPMMGPGPMGMGMGMQGGMMGGPFMRPPGQGMMGPPGQFGMMRPPGMMGMPGGGFPMRPPGMPGQG